VKIEFARFYFHFPFPERIRRMQERLLLSADGRVPHARGEDQGRVLSKMQRMRLQQGAPLEPHRMDGSRQSLQGPALRGGGCHSVGFAVLHPLCQSSTSGAWKMLPDLSR
jgi:hypothetical protein